MITSTCNCCNPLMKFYARLLLNKLEINDTTYWRLSLRKVGRTRKRKLIKTYKGVLLSVLLQYDDGGV